MHYTKSILTLVFIVLISISVQAQNYTSYNLTKDSVYIGDPVYVQLKIIKSSNLTPIDLSPLQQFKAISDTSQVDVTIESYGDWKVNDEYIVDMNSIVWTTNDKGKQESTTQLKIVFWDNGRYRFPQIKLTNGMPLQSPVITVFAPQDVLKEAGDSTLVIMPIKSIIKEYKDISDYLPYLIGLLVLFSLIGLFWYNQNRKANQVIEEVIIIERPAHIIALEELNTLDKKQLWQNGKIKAYQSELTHIIRAYLGKRYHVNALENTTEEVIKLLKNTDFDDGLQSQVSNILQMADMIKFAKATPSEDIHQSFWDQAKNLIEKTKLIEPISSKN